MAEGGQVNRIGTRLFAGVLLIYSVCPPFTSNDSYFVVPTALSLLRHGTPAVDEFVPGAPPEPWYAAECVRARDTVAGDALGCAGHWYNFYPEGVPVLMTPVVAVLWAATGVPAAVFPALPRGRRHGVDAGRDPRGARRDLCGGATMEPVSGECGSGAGAGFRLGYPQFLRGLK